MTPDVLFLAGAFCGGLGIGWAGGYLFARASAMAKPEPPREPVEDDAWGWPAR